jgi:hypothetical protein
MSNVVVGLSVSLDGFVAGPNDGPGNPLGDGGGKLFEWWTAGTERLGPDDRFRPPGRSRGVVEETFAVGAIITGRRTFDIAGGWGGHPPIGVPFFVLTTTRRTGGSGARHRRDCGHRRHRERPGAGPRGGGRPPRLRRRR